MEGLYVPKRFIPAVDHRQCMWDFQRFSPRMGFEGANVIFLIAGFHQHGHGAEIC
jgi:hypothetical protein